MSLYNYFVFHLSYLAQSPVKIVIQETSLEASFWDFNKAIANKDNYREQTDY